MPSYAAEAKERQRAAGKEHAANLTNQEGSRLRQKVAEADKKPKTPNKTSAELAAEATGANSRLIWYLKSRPAEIPAG
jgi:hypothetical protein